MMTMTGARAEGVVDKAFHVGEYRADCSKLLLDFVEKGGDALYVSHPHSCLQ